jgi:hypothetical protein
MSQENKNTAAEAVAVLQSNLDAATEVLKNLPETASNEEKAEAGKAVGLAKKALSQATATSKTEKPVKEKQLKGIFLLSPTGRFGLAYSAGEKASLPELQATELEEAGYFRIDK